MKYGSTIGKWALVGVLATGVLPPAGAVLAEGEGVILSEYIEGSSNNKAIEIFNGSGQIINLSDYALIQYTNGGPTEAKITLSGTIEPGKTFVIANSSANADIKAKAQQTTGSLNFNGNDPVALKKGDAIVDIIGPIGSSSDFAKDTTLVRSEAVVNGVTAYDATQWSKLPVDTIAGLGTHTASGDSDIVVAPTATPTGEVERGTKVTLSAEGVIHYTLDGSTPTASSPVYSEAITINDEITVKAIAIKDGKSSAVSSFKYYIAPPITKISTIQGASQRSPLEGEKVRTSGIVTYVADGSNFYMQDPNADSDSKTSEGILVYAPNHGVTVGQAVSTTGFVKEWILGGYSDKFDTDLAVTEINSVNLVKGALNEGLPASIVLGGDGVLIPTKVIDNDAFAQFDPEEDAIDLYESLEGMRVALPNAIVTGPQANRTIPVRTQTTDKLYTKRGTPILQADNANPERLFVEMGSSSYRAKAGDRFEGTIEGVMSYNYSAYKVLTKAANLPTLITSEVDRKPTTIATDDSRLTIASYNVENFASTADAGKVDRVSEGIAKFLKTPDIVGLTEMQDNDGATDSGTVDASKSFETLIAAIEAKTGVRYAYTDIAPVDKEDGGQPGGNIRVGFLYNPARVQLAAGEKGSATEAVKVEDGKLSHNPGRIEPNDPNFESSRKPLVGEFVFKGESYHVIVNHFNSKGGDGADFGKNQPVVRKSEVQRHAIANIVNDFVESLEKEIDEPNVVVLGDLNDFQFSKTLDILKGDVLYNTVDDLPENERYSYIYNGNAQVLDHILISDRLKALTESDIVNINSDYMEADGSASDHDPAIISIEGVERQVAVDGKAVIGDWRVTQKGVHNVIEHKVGSTWIKVGETHGLQQGELLELRVMKDTPYIEVKTKKEGTLWLTPIGGKKLGETDKF
ncbi:chitobiase/beta-hexosaminidase C-terminal domain-containing protein [Exiguobacterium flavidum]|uniref:chitobiase/beta-hexosaminidase C-terminal domain-containing protein n=1 Tax=Exiguobacterium flavidum TaxID=2184695 RepID=UPI000DF7A799|nr:chitobiase/beta-hexosaminidase C-terminal domain-containing protein [Exiguobacterium flavidum]